MGMIRIEGGDDINALRSMIEQGLISEEDLTKMTMTGGLVSSTPPSRLQQQPQRKLRVVGYGNGQVTDLGEEAWSAPPLDYTRGGIEIAGLGKGQYGADGRSAYVQTPQGMTKVLLGYDADASDARNDRALQRRVREEAIATSQAARTQKEGPKRQWSTDMNAWVEEPSPQYPRGRVLAPDGAAAGGSMLKSSDDEKKSAGLAIRMELALRQMQQNPEGASPQWGPEILRKIPLVGEPLANAATPYERQTVEAAQLDALDAALTLATGAAYTKEQLANLAKSYFPQLNDKPQAVEDKKARLAAVIEAARIRAGRMGPSINNVLDASAIGKGGAGQVPPPQQRVVGQYYDTPRGKAQWMGNGWRLGQ